MNKLVNQKGLTSIHIVILIGVVLLGYLFYSGKIALPQKQTDQPIAETSKVDETADWKTYTNTKYGFEVKYPNDWIMTDECDEKSENCGENWKVVTSYVPALGPTGDYTGGIYVALKTYNSINEAVQDRLASTVDARSCSIEVLDKDGEIGEYKNIWGYVSKKNVLDTTEEGQVNCLNIAYYLSDGKRYFEMSGGFEEGNKHYDIVNKILSTFKFQ